MTERERIFWQISDKFTLYYFSIETYLKIKLADTFPILLLPKNVKFLYLRYNRICKSNLSRRDQLKRETIKEKKKKKICLAKSKNIEGRWKKDRTLCRETIVFLNYFLIKKTKIFVNRVLMLNLVSCKNLFCLHPRTTLNKWEEEEKVHVLVCWRKKGISLGCLPSS